MAEPIYFQLDSFPDIPFSIESISEKENEIVFEISTKNPEQEHLIDSPLFKESLKLFLEDLVKEALEKAKDLLSNSDLSSEGID